ncbi:MAG: hypothetical protein SPI14_05480 [Arcanobacterium sp.]|nr:hypothetical protein [Arcanobacterium sp.]
MIDTITNGGARLSVSTIGATLMEWDPGIGQNVIAGYRDEDELIQRDGYRSAVLAPWVNRLADAQWTDSDGNVHSVEEATGSAQGLHGLFTLHEFEVKRTGAALELRGFIPASSAYPADVSVLVRYALGGDGVLQVNISALNVSGPAAPICVGWHPYFRVVNRENARVRVFGTQRVLMDFALIPLPGAQAYQTIAFRSDASDIGQIEWSTINTDDDYTITGLHYNSLGVAKAQLDTGYGLVTMMATSNTPEQAAFHVYSGHMLARGSEESIALEPLTAIGSSYNRSDVAPHIMLDKDGVRTLDLRIRYTAPE